MDKKALKKSPSLPPLSEGMLRHQREELLRDVFVTGRHFCSTGSGFMRPTVTNLRSFYGIKDGRFIAPGMGHHWKDSRGYALAIYAILLSAGVPEDSLSLRTMSWDIEFSTGQGPWALQLARQVDDIRPTVVLVDDVIVDPSLWWHFSLQKELPCEDAASFGVIDPWYCEHNAVSPRYGDFSEEGWDWFMWQSGRDEALAYYSEHNPLKNLPICDMENALWWLRKNLAEKEASAKEE